MRRNSYSSDSHWQRWGPNRIGYAKPYTDPWSNHTSLAVYFPFFVHTVSVALSPSVNARTHYCVVCGNSAKALFVPYYVFLSTSKPPRPERRTISRCAAQPVVACFALGLGECREGPEGLELDRHGIRNTEYGEPYEGRSNTTEVMSPNP